MALTKCKDCGHDVSTSAGKCPNCGAPVKKRISLWGLIASVLCLFLFIGYCSTFMTSDQDKNKPRNAITVQESNPRPEPASGGINQHRLTRYAHKTVNMRAGAGEGFRVLDKLSRGDIVAIQDTVGDWVKVYSGNYLRGYAKKSLLEEYPIPPIEIVSWNWYKDPGFAGEGAVVWNVEIQNNSPDFQEYIHVELATYDAADNLITSDETYVQSVAPGGRGSAKAFADYHGNEASARIRIVR